MNRYHKHFDQLATEKKQDELTIFLTKNQHIRTLLIGMIIGHMTSNELSNYQNDTSEYHKRALQMIAQRVSDHIDYFQ